MPTTETYCPYDVTPLLACVGGTEHMVATEFGRLRCVTSGLAAPIGGDRGTVFVHGVHDDMDSWSPLVEAAARQAVDLGPTLFVDLPGFGRSQNRRGRLDLTEVGDMLMQVANDTGLESVRLVGHSMGTLVVADMAVRHAARVESLHLAAGPYYSVVETMNGHPSGGYAGGLAAAAFGSQYLLALTAGVGVATVRMASRRRLLRPLLAPYAAHPNDLPESVVDHLVSGMRPRSFRAAARNGFNYRDGMSWSKVACPVWAVYGMADRLVPAVDAQRLQADIPSARITHVPDASHLVHVEQPAAALVGLGLT
ncbi:MAG: alpha/beta hydrolase [Actinomycetota bacterium]|nr:alpha/beta hydrolase [Actinomycetota bacterium]